MSALSPWLAVVLLGAPDPALRAARRALESGDLVGWIEARSVVAAPSTPKSGAWGRLDDAAALVRCRPLPPWWPSKETPSSRGLRALLRFEAARLRRYLADGAYAKTELPLLVAASQALRLRAETREPTVRWPLEAERWPGEHPLPILRASQCAPSPPEDGGGVGSGVRARLRKERRALERVMAEIESLPAAVVGGVAVAWLTATEADTEPLDVVPEVLERVLTALRAAPEGPHRDRALVQATRLALRDGPRPQWAPELRAIEARAGGPLRWKARIARVLADPAGRRASSALAGADPPETVRAWLDHVHALALAEADDAAALRRFSHAFLQRRKDHPVDRETFDILLDTLLTRPPETALSEASQLGDPAPAAVRDRWWSLGLRALERGRLRLARGVLDRLWFEAVASSAELPADVPLILSTRARVALALFDVETFTALVDTLEAEIDSPARRRAVLGLAQDAAARLPSVEPELRKVFATGALRLLPPRARDSSVARLLSAWARDGAEVDVRLPSRRRPEPLPIPLGETRVRRKLREPPPPTLDVDDPPIPSFFVWEAPEGELRLGLPPGLKALAEAPSKP